MRKAMVFLGLALSLVVSLAMPRGDLKAGSASLASPTRVAGAAPTPRPHARSSTTPATRGTNPAPAAGARRFDPGAVTLTLEPVASGLAEPVYVAQPADGSSRLFVVERAGTIRIVSGGTVLPQPFLDIGSLVNTEGGERGLLGLAFHPGFAANGRFYVHYTTSNGDVTVAEYRVSTDPNIADPASGRVLLAIPHPTYTNHNGGMLAFGPDGYLYIGPGDGGGGGDPQGNAQNLLSLKGKLLRIDVDGGVPYGIPVDNPFVGQIGALPEIWAFGLRNPWRFSFDAGTGDLWIADVGQALWEEIDLQPAGDPGGENYGWNVMEGMHCYPPGDTCSTDGLTLPIAEYGHSDGDCAIIGGYVYRGTVSPILTGAYIFGDLCSGRIWALYQDPSGAWQRATLLQADAGISSFGEDQAGELYLANVNTGNIYHLAATAGTPHVVPASSR